MVNKLEKLVKLLGVETVAEMEAESPEQVKARIINAESAIKQAKDDLEANEKYKEMKENLKALSLGMREVRKRQQGVIAYALHLLESKGTL